MKVLGLIAVLLLSLLVGGYLFATRAEKVHWTEEATLQDGRTLKIQREVRLTYSAGGELSELARKSPNYYLLEFSHPDTGDLVEWKGDFGYNPVLIDFVNHTPYLVILQFNVFANLKQYGCPPIPYVFFRFDMNNRYWEQISSSVFPAVLSHANLTASYDGGYISEGTQFTTKEVALRNAESEGAGTVGYFSITIPKDFESWDFEHKYEERNRHFQDGCRPEKLMPVPEFARRVSLAIDERKDFEPELVIHNADDPASSWQQLLVDKQRSEMCKTFLRPADPSFQGGNAFIQDTTGQKHVRGTGPVICDTDSVWTFDYAAEKKRVVIAKYRSNGDIAFRVSFAKPDESDGYQGSVMYPTFKSEKGYLSFEWWNFRNSGSDVHVKRSLKIKVRELLGD